MTEYDYSPDAVERYYAKQNSVARWVDRQAHEAHAYGNPFVPPTPVFSAGASSSAHTKPVSRSASIPVDSRRTRTSTITGTGSGSTTTAHTGRSHREHRDRDRAMNTSAVHTQDTPRYNSRGNSGTGTSSQTHSRSQSQGYPSRRPPPARSNTYALAKNSVSSTHLPTRSATLPAQPQPQHAQQTTQYTAPGGTVVMQNGRQTVVFPPHGARIHIPPQQAQGQQTVSPTSHALPYQHQQVVYPIIYAQQPISPTSTAKKQPLLKRIFGTASNSNSNANANDYYAGSRRAGGGVPVISASGARRRTTSMHY